MKALWKQQVPLHPTFAPLNRCLEQDWFLLPFELRLQRAHAEALHRANIFSDAEYSTVLAAVEAIERETAGQPCPESSAEDLHTWVEGKLVELAGDPGKKIHTARSRNDQIATLLKLYVVNRGQQLSRQLSNLIRTCCLRAAHWSDLIFPLQTHSQFAAPGSVGAWALRYATAFDRGRRQLDRSVTAWMDFCPLGAGAVAGSSIPIDRQVQAKALGFARPALNALDATSTRDECLSLLAMSTQIALHLQSLAADVIAFSQTPFSWTKYPAAFGTGSSMMPNKTNPDAMELLRGQANAILAAHGQAVLLLKGLPSGYNRDLQCIKPIVKDAVESLGGLLEMATAFLTELEFDEARLAKAIEQGSIGATLRMEQQVQAGVPLREAHHAIATELKQTGDLPSEPSTLAHATSTSSLSTLSADAYQTVGCASAVETRRVADLLLESLDRMAPSD